ncbi:MAG: hypothetical protein ACRDTZ_03350 [Pseudonocardiaceae bacterium]
MAWGVVANIKGETGDTGAQGPTGSQGIQGIQGPAGEDGAGVTIAGQVDTYGDLPIDLVAGDAGDGYLVDADGKLYVWTGSAFPSDGSGVEFRGPIGATGAQGATGPAGEQGTAGATGATGATGSTGPRGATWFDGEGAPGTIGGSQPGDYYLDTLDGTVYKLS